MTTYNPNDFSPMSGKEINSQGNVVTPADGINADGSVNVQIPGHNVQEIQFFNGLAIADINVHYSGTGGSGTPTSVANLSGRKIIHYSNSLNQSVSLTVNAYNSLGGFAAGLGTFTCPAGQSGIITATNIAGLLEPIQQIKMVATCSTAPTSGAFSAFLEGVQS